MNSNHSVGAPAIPSKPYSMFVDNIGIIQFGEVAEKPSRLNSKMGANEKLPSTVLVLTPQQCESLKKDRIFKLINRSKMEELFEFMQEAREMDRKIELEHATEEVREQGTGRRVYNHDQKLYKEL